MIAGLRAGLWWCLLLVSFFSFAQAAPGMFFPANMLSPWANILGPWWYIGIGYTALILGMVAKPVNAGCITMVVINGLALMALRFNYTTWQSPWVYWVAGYLFLATAILIPAIAWSINHSQELRSMRDPHPFEVARFNGAD